MEIWAKFAGGGWKWLLGSMTFYHSTDQRQLTKCKRVHPLNISKYIHWIVVLYFLMFILVSLMGESNGVTCQIEVVGGGGGGWGGGMWTVGVCVGWGGGGWGGGGGVGGGGGGWGGGGGGGGGVLRCVPPDISYIHKGPGVVESHPINRSKCQKLKINYCCHTMTMYISPYTDWPGSMCWHPICKWFTIIEQMSLL